ncbi:MAG TPA: HD domain-containing phosphohydrolase [Coriobacteriia bacterium]|nr:HD domain-containing phosphohydrolase [Coriobacteriia bacterium]
MGTAMDLSEFAIVAAAILLDLVLGGMALQRNSRSITNQLFAVATVAISVWLALNFMCDQPRFYAHALLLNRLATGAATMMGLLLVAFVVCFPRRVVHLAWEWWAGLTPLVTVGVLSASTPLVIKSVTIESWGSNVVQGPLFPWVGAYGVLLLTGVAAMLARRFRAADSRMRAQYKYLYLGLGLFMSSTLVLAVLLPMVSGTNEFLSLLPFCTLTLLVPTSYAIIRHELMDVSFVVLRSVAYSAVMLAFAVFVVGVAQIARTEVSTTLGISPDALVLATVLATVVAFHPVRTLVEKATDSFFFRRTYDPSALLNDLGRQMASTFNETELAQLLSTELADKMRLTFAAVVFRCDDEIVTCASLESFEMPDLTEWLLEHEDLAAALFTDDPDEGAEDVAALGRAGVRVVAPLRRDGSWLGAIVLGAKQSGLMFSQQDLRFLDVLVSEAVIAMNNAHLFDERNQRVRELVALNQLATALGHSTELKSVLATAIHQIVTVTSADAGSIMLLDEDAETLTVAASVGVDPAIASTSRLRLGEGVAGWVAEHRRALVLPRDRTPSFEHELVRDDVASSICTPVVSKNKVIGVLNVSRVLGSKPFSQESFHVVSSFAGQLGIAIENARLFEELSKTFLGTIGALAAAVDAKDPYTFGHSTEVTRLAVATAEALELEEREVQRIRVAATLHDIGKIGIDADILLKSGALTPEERETINHHPAIGAGILAPLEFLREIVPYILSHHERYDGGGYPSGLSSEAIPLGARVISVADSYNAMVSDRPYRTGLSHQQAIDELRANSGTQFDPSVVRAFMRIVDSAPVEVPTTDLAAAAPIQPATTTVFLR